jgi:hypothetical protein
MSQSPWLDNAESVSRVGESYSGEVKPPKAETENFYVNRLKRGFASGAAALADTPARAFNLGVAGIGSIAGMSGLTPPQLPFDSNHYTNAMQRVLGAPEAVEPNSRGQAIAGAMVEGVGSGIGGGIPLAGMLNTAKTIPGAVGQYVAQQGGLGALAGGGAEIGGQVGGQAGSVIGGVIGGTVLPSSFLRYGPGVVGAGRAAYETVKDMNAAKNMASAGANAAATRASPIVERMVNNQLRDAVAGTPNAAQNLDDALAIQSKIPNFKPSVAEMSGSQGAAQMQTKYAMTSPVRMNSEIARMEANRAAIDDYYQSVAPTAQNPSAIRSSVNQSLADAGKSAVAGEQTVASSLPVGNQFQLGSRLTELANEAKSAAKPAISAAYEKAFTESGGAQVSVAPVVAKVEDILGARLSQIKPETAPQTVQAIRRIFGDKTHEMTGRSVPPDLMSEIGMAAKDASMRDLHDIRVAINQDMASAGRSLDPSAATRLYNLRQVMPEIDAAMAKLPGNDAYLAANQKYSTEYAPRFKEGTNLQLFKDKSTNEPRILPDRFVSEFFKPDASAGISRSLQFNTLFGANQEAKALANQGIMDTYRAKVVDPNTGVINQSNHAAFVRDYGRTLSNFDANGVPALANITRIGKDAASAAALTDKINQTSKTLKFDTVDDMVNSAIKEPRVMANALANMPPKARSQMARLVMDKAIEGGSAASISKFLIDHEKTLKMIPGMESKHKADLTDIAKAYEIMERAPLRGNVQTGGPDLIKNATGVSTPTIQSQIRAWTGGRQAFATGALNVGIPMLYKLSQTKFTDVMENALHNPETAKNLRDFLNAKSAGQAEFNARGIMESMKDIGRVAWSAKGPILKHFVGADRYHENFARTGGAIAADIQEKTDGEIK